MFSVPARDLLFKVLLIMYRPALELLYTKSGAFLKECQSSPHIFTRFAVTGGGGRHSMRMTFNGINHGLVKGLYRDPETGGVSSCLIKTYQPINMADKKLAQDMVLLFSGNKEIISLFTNKLQVRIELPQKAVRIELGYGFNKVRLSHLIIDES